MYLFSCVSYAFLVTSTVYSASVKNEFESALLRPEECSDSNYRCANITTAIQCNAFQHCMQKIWPNTKKIANFRDTSDLIEDRFNPMILPTNAVAVKGSTQCDFCKVVMNSIQTQLKNEDVRQDVQRIIKEACTLLPKSDRAECGAIMNHSLSFIIKLLADEADASVFCSIFHFCPKLQSEYTFFFCPICRGLIRFAQIVMKHPLTETVIAKILNTACIFLPEKEECHNFVNEYIKSIWNLVASAVDPSTICPILRLCPEVSARQDQCQSCTYTINSLIDSLKDRNAAQIYTALKNLPKSLPKEYTVSAFQIGLEHRDEVVDMMIAEFSAPETCAHLNYCQQYQSEFINGDVETDEIESVSSIASPNCAVCKLIVTVYKNKMISKAVEKDLEAYLSNFCTSLPKHDQKNCYDVTNNDVPRIFRILRKDLLPEKLCQVVELCPKV